MNITVINGTEKHGVTYRLKEMFLAEFRDKANITEYYLPKDCPNFCVGCLNCTLKGENTCKDAEYIGKIDKSLLEADLIVMTSPAYVFHATGAMKALLDHFAYRWIPHRPAPEMFGKRAVIITQCLGSGARSAAKDMKHSLSWWGISKIEIFTGALMSTIFWEELSRKKQAELTGKIQKLSKKFVHIDYTKPAHTNLITKFKVFFCRMMQKSIHKSDPEYLDGKYWAEQGWLKKTDRGNNFIVSTIRPIHWCLLHCSAEFSERVFSKSVNDFIIVLTESVNGGYAMNERFFLLPTEKQQAIINAGYRVFSQNSYKNSPMSEIADAAGISKSLLFHYFHNKKELYMFLWDKCAETTIEYLTKCGCYGQKDLFESMERGMRAKMEIIRLYPHMANFTIKAFYEKDADISAAVQESYHKYFNLKADKTRVNMDPSQFIEGLDIPMMYREMYWASEGYLWEMVQRGNVDIKQMEKDFSKLMDFWKSIYLRKE